ncbi:MAG: hypothetical protein HYS26_01015 [Candidatus Kaiserbacteria bacterium]|nr:MAG: hypothetical protein HYS26_01015 [Candidatus Kaiserbacteria bacterium]
MGLENKKSLESEAVDIQKLGQDFADLADQRRFAEIQILAKQVRLTPQQLSNTFEQAIRIMQKKSPLTLTNRPITIGLTGGALLGMLAGQIVVGAMAGGSAGAIVDQMQEHAQRDKLQKLIEAKEWLEKSNS